MIPRFRFVLVALSMIAFTALPALAMPVTIGGTEVEPNDDFADATVLPGIPGPIFGFLDSAEPIFNADLNFSDELIPGEISEFRIGGQTPGEDFFAFTRTTFNSDVGFENDTIMRSLDDALNQIAVDDDGSPLTELGSALSGQVNPDGTINLDVSGFDDFDFLGEHEETGLFDLFIQLGTSEFISEGENPGDVDFFTLTDLDPGAPFTLEVVSADFDTILGLFDETGGFIDDDDDGGADLLSRISGTVNPDGTVRFAIAEFDDFDFEGNIFGVGGEYEIAFIPEPASFGMMLLGGAMMTRRRRG